MFSSQEFVTVFDRAVYIEFSKWTQLFGDQGTKLNYFTI
jgi:hypothetical protein